MEPVIRRVIAARIANTTDVDDLVQDCLERLLVVHQRLAPEAVLPYAVVTARNLVSSTGRNAMRRAAAAPRLHDASEPDRPEDVLLANEARQAMTAALAQLSDAERHDLLNYHDIGTAKGAATGPARSALRVRMARTRAKLRLEYLLAYRHLELPTPQCRGILLAISAGDTRRQRQLDAAQHLLDCQTCAALSEPLDRRSVALTAIAIPGALLGWLARQIRAHPVQTTAGVTVGSAAVAVAAVLAARLATTPAPARPVQASAPRSSAAPRPVPVISNLTIGGHAVSDAEAAHSIRSLVGAHASASGVAVVMTVTRNGFWIGSDRARIWVQLTGPLRPLRLRTGDRVRFSGAVVGNSPSFFSDQPGLASRSDKKLLARQGAHVAVSTTSISVLRRS